MEPLRDGGTKFIYLAQVTWSRWPPCPYILKKEPGLTLTFIYHKVIFCPFVHFSVASGLCDMEMQSTSGSLNCRGQGQRSLFYCLSISTEDFFSDTTGQIPIKFHMQPSGKGGNV